MAATAAENAAAAAADTAAVAALAAATYAPPASTTAATAARQHPPASSAVKKQDKKRKARKPGHRSQSPMQASQAHHDVQTAELKRRQKPSHRRQYLRGALKTRHWADEPCGTCQAAGKQCVAPPDDGHQEKCLRCSANAEPCGKRWILEQTSATTMLNLLSTKRHVRIIDLGWLVAERQVYGEHSGGPFDKCKDYSSVLRLDQPAPGRRLYPPGTRVLIPFVGRSNTPILAPGLRLSYSSHPAGYQTPGALHDGSLRSQDEDLEPRPSRTQDKCIINDNRSIDALLLAHVARRTKTPTAARAARSTNGTSAAIYNLNTDHHPQHKPHAGRTLHQRPKTIAISVVSPSRALYATMACVL
ncbi:uncharacterized protein PAN0_004d2155 [Moesziomyces antarcticus]|uniref:Uncharacterized protein n=2 Tax=Pseudozyma antarctica TaxID=84753 RepID=A0A081CBA0_PSEA2|nr:uncharacterized protein PAN0_004d2155 [Moesziomyces antarcticus]GAK63946.1 hypothetical protein PAN0_004d2155 [Moesziomyces antarcticus]SPO44842.1 uncharacterized protein PSANT_02528 [Moesziomyces antarcticus]